LRAFGAPYPAKFAAFRLARAELRPFPVRACLAHGLAMPRLLHDRYVAYDGIHGCDLATGDDVRVDALPPPRTEEEIPALIELLSNGTDGQPRWVVADVANAMQAAVTARRAAAAARTRGFVPVLVTLYERLRGLLEDDLSDRTLLLIGSFSKSVTAARSALVYAAAASPRPHVLLTFRATAEHRAACLVREARTAYGARPASQRVGGLPVALDIARHLERAGRAAEFQQSGRHAAAERLLRDVAGALTRRGAESPAAETLLRLGRLLLERGRAAAAEKVFADAAERSTAAGEEGAALDARLWQAIARTDAARLTEAESICRAVLLTRALAPSRHVWAQASLARILCWQGRLQEARRAIDDSGETPSFKTDEATAASIDAIAVRTLLAAGDPFRAGIRARALLNRVDQADDPLVQAIACTAHLRVVVEAGDMHVAEQRFRDIALLARRARAPLRAVRARLIWHDALRRSGRTREAERELRALERIRRVAPALLRRSIEERVKHPDRCPDRHVRIATTSRESSCAAALVRMVHEEENDQYAVRRLVAHIVAELSPSRIDLASADAGPISTLLTAGAGLSTRLAERVLETGIVLSGVEHGGRELGVPIRLGPRLIGALVARWPLDREPPPEAEGVLTLAAAVAAPRVDALLTAARETARSTTSVPELLGVSAAMADVRRAIERAARAPFSVLVEGESGVGKELAARAIHQLSVRRERRFCDVNCAALPDDLLDSELFGHAKGAFTGAVTDKAGLFEEADGGTLFLDEVADLSARGQAKLLRVLQQHEVRRVGETFTRKVDVRLVAAANREMRDEVQHGRFRSDLLFRIDVVHLRIPPLRERPEDIPVLAHHFWSAAASRVGSRATLTHAVLADLARYGWPGNVRELQNVMSALAVAAPSNGRVRSSALPCAITSASVVTSRHLADARSEFERRFVEVALGRAGGSRTRAAADLGLSRQGLLKTMARLGIEAPVEQAPGLTDAPGDSSAQTAEDDR
jgi:DNA-binding NtrC family response regulator/tetratricopeptide (TPR) repeat protein